MDPKPWKEHLAQHAPTRDKLHGPPAAFLAKVIVIITYPASLQGGCECPHVTDEKAEANAWLWSDRLTGGGGWNVDTGLYPVILTSSKAGTEHSLQERKGFES